MAPSGPERVAAAAEALGLDIEVVRMSASTRTADEAAAACGCTAAQIVKSLVFQRPDGAFRLVLIPGDRRLDADAAEAATGTRLSRADPRAVRAATGYAIGAIPPIGHATELPVLMDRRLMAHNSVWAAAGAPDAVFAVEPGALHRATTANLLDLSA